MRSSSAKGVRKAIIHTIASANRILRGKYGYALPDAMSDDPQEVVYGPILDLNDETLTAVEIQYVSNWIKKHLGADIIAAPVKTTYVSPDGLTIVTVYDVALGKKGDTWYISQWQTNGEKPSYVFWQEELYEIQLMEMEYREVISRIQEDTV